MKKSITSILCLISILLSFTFSFYYRGLDIERIQEIEKNEDSFDIYIASNGYSLEEFTQRLELISKKYNASIIRSDQINVDNNLVTIKSGIFSDSYFSEIHLDLISGRLPKNKNEFLATFDTNKQGQVGIIRDIFSDSPLIFNSLKSFLSEYDSSLNSKYSINVENKEEFIKDIQNTFEMTYDEIYNIPFFREYKQGAYFYILLVMLLVLIILLILISLLNPLKNIQMVGVLKLQGYTNIDALKLVNSKVLVLPILTYLISIPIQYILITNVSSTYFFKLTLLQLLVILIYYISLFLSLLIIKRYTILNAIKGFFEPKTALYLNYITKFVILSLLILVIPIVSKELSNLKMRIDVKKLYEEQEKYLTISSYQFVDNEFQEGLNNTSKLDDKFLNLFKDLEKNSAAQYMFAEKLYPIYLEPQHTRANITFQGNEYINTVQANWNYIDTLNLDTKKIEKDEKSYKLLISSHEKEHEEEILSILGQHINNFYPIDKMYKNEKDIPITIYYYTNKKMELFSNNIDMINENNGILTNPAIIVMDNFSLTKNNSRLFDGALYNPLKILNNKENIENINKAITKNGLEKNNLNFENSFSSGYEKELKMIKMSILFYLFILIIFISISLLSSYFILIVTFLIGKKEILISKFLGYKYTDIYKQQIRNILIIYVLGLIETLLLENEKITICIFSILILVDATISFIMFKKQDKQLLNNALKGEIL
ncbi:MULTISPECIES: hypothetical protein [Vagococcus]|uniref:DUF1430 domain-containing protein n=1 Tax=Vagococcus carniphilus TaxID=218144 RepID=A0A430AQY2_9ENTE|nr:MULTISPECIES: hypothetical protein [Vagococcus]MBO0444334.1 hypothetical protein [Vagococcus fluvialis]QNN74583.1 hypothetical protein H9L18_14870 [Vagococcus carniphilus]RSU10393.1 hypothetical protein CBF28_13830 [Vagococcus carniphilus]